MSTKHCHGCDPEPEPDHNVCDSQCNLPCEQVVLDVNSMPSTITAAGDTLTLVYRLTNVSGRAIRGPIVVSSSLGGTVFISDRGMDAGTTLEVQKDITITNDELRFPTLKDVSFAAAGKPTGEPGSFTPGSRISPVVTTNITVLLNNPQLTVSGTITDTPIVGGTGDRIRMSLMLDSTGSPLSSLMVTVPDIFVRCASSSITPSNPNFKLDSNGNIVSTSSFLAAGMYTVTVVGVSCQPLTQPSYVVNYDYQSRDSTSKTGSVTVPVNPPAPAKVVSGGSACFAMN